MMLHSIDVGGDGGCDGGYTCNITLRRVCV